MKIDLDYLMDVVDDNIGFCLNCGAEHDCVEPDARKYECEECGERQVYGAQEILLMGYYE